MTISKVKTEKMIIWEEGFSSKQFVMNLEVQCSTTVKSTELTFDPDSPGEHSRYSWKVPWT